MSGMLASALLSSIDGRFLYAVVGQVPICQQSTVGAVGDQGVQGLRDRLTSEGGPAEDWARLVTSLMVLGDQEGARQALTQAKAAHQGGGSL